MEIKVNTERLENLNKGVNFLNIEEKSKPKRYFIKVFLDSCISLKEQNETLNVETNLPFISWSYWSGTEVEEFFEKLDKFSKNPLAIIKPTNRKDKVSSYELSDIRNAIRNITINFEDIDFEIGELAQKKLTFDFKEKVKEMLKQQEVNRDVQNDVDRFVGLKEKILTLESFKDKKSYYSYDRNKDETGKIRLTPKEYNEQLKKIETEMKVIAEKFGIELGEFDYMETELDFDDWLEENEDELRENFDFYNEDKNLTFEQYCKNMYDECGGLIF